MDNITTGFVHLIKNRSILLTVFFMSLFYGTPAMAHYPYKYSIPEAQNYHELPYTLIELIRALPQPLPAKLETFQKIVRVPLHVSDTNGVFTGYGASSLKTKDGVIIKGMGVDIRNSEPNIIQSIGIAFDQGQCVDANLLKKEFNLYAYSLYPNPEYPDKTKVDYNKILDWGLIGMGIYQNKPDCALDFGTTIFNSDQERNDWLKYRKQFTDKQSKN